MIVVTTILGTEAPTSHCALVFESGRVLDITNDRTARESAQQHIDGLTADEYRVGQGTWDTLMEWRNEP